MLSMNYTKNTAIFAFAALLMALPLVNSNAFGDGSASVDEFCSVAIPGDINMGTIGVGIEGNEINLDMTTGDVSGTLSLTQSDWTGVGTLARATMTLVGVATSDTFTINTLGYQAVSSLSSAGDFLVGGTDTITAANLAAVITADSRTGATDDVTATSSFHIVFLKSVTLGTVGNGIVVVEGVTNTGTVVSGNLAGAEASGVVHLQAEVTKFRIFSDGTESSGELYSAKTAIGVDSEAAAFMTLFTSANDVQLSMQITGVGTLELLPYDGALVQTLTFTVVCS